MSIEKPTWGNAPEWANWLAQELDGSWFWYEKEPWYIKSKWIFNGKCKIASQITLPKEKRPT